ncbi:spore protease YyaC [Alkalicoccus halolimnae]|uniref:Spore protease YyaC n=1 Tax=Alkalicoccus halolimnae TaxID=1667239 RepID=A0A5C7FH69_9BACI|nr:spore protease YyaC [Alkalicoccus halolimnae]TXF85634.1 spore protease YyaC [Alkalicoccus halolimnae]
MNEPSSNRLTRYSSESVTAPDELTAAILNKTAAVNLPIVIVCIGTDRSTGDSLGPLTGSLLEEKMPSQFFIYGTLENPVHAKNLHLTMQHIEKVHPASFIIAVDASLGRRENVGTIVLGEGPLFPGAALNRTLSPVGDLYLTGIINVSGFMEFSVLQNTRLHIVMKIARLLSQALYAADQEKQREFSALSDKTTNVVPFPPWKNKEAEPL